MRRTAQEVNGNSPDYVPARHWLARVYLWACERLYAELAWGYDAVSWLVSAGQWRQWQSGVWVEVRGEDVLEMGCGTGALLVQGLGHSKHLVGLDRSPAMLAVARHRVAASPFACPLLQGDGRDLPVASGVFDTVMATFPAGYILDHATLSEVHRVLRHQGRLVIVGLWVEVRLGGLERLMPLFYGRPNVQTQQAIARRVADAGFDLRWIEQRSGRFSVGGLVATRATE